ncbi:unnamed protein product, partial [Polarella glacialis]
MWLREDAHTLRHPDDMSSVSAATFAPSSAVGANPWLQPQASPEYLGRLPPGKLLQGGSQARQPALITTRGSPTDSAVPPRGFPETQFEGGMSPNQGPSIPRLQLGTAAAVETMKQRSTYDAAYEAAYAPQSWKAESEIDRIIRDRLEGQHTDRAHMGNRMKGLAENHLSFAGQLQDAVYSGGWALLEGLQYGGSVLLGRVPTVEPTAACKRVAKAIPVIIFEGDTDDEEEAGAAPMTHYREPGDEFADLIAQPIAASLEPVPGRVRREDMPAFTPVGGHQASDGSYFPADQYDSHYAPPVRPSPEAPKAPPAAERLADSSRLPAASAAAEPAARAAMQRPSDAKSAFVGPSSGMTSSAAGSLGAFMSRGAAPPAAAAPRPPAQEVPAPAEAPGREAPEKRPPTTTSVAYSDPAPQPAGPPPADAAPRQPAPIRPSGGASKSVFAASSGMTSSAASSLAGFMGGGARSRPAPSAASEAPPAAVEPAAAPPTVSEVEPPASRESPTKRPPAVSGQSKSVLGNSS